MRQTAAVIVGAGPAGLAMSRELTGVGVDHVILERGQVAQSWRTERWDSLRLLTPSRLSRLPGEPEPGPETAEFESAAEVVDRLVRHRGRWDAPVHEGVCVGSVRPTGSGFTVETDHGPWQCRAVVVATGPGLPAIPRGADLMPTRLEQLAARDYRRPEQLPDGPVLVVGASASGVQIAEELNRAGREVSIAVGNHVRLIRQYRGRDIYDWFRVLGLLGDRFDEVDDLDRQRRLPSAQLIGTPERRALDLGTLDRSGVVVLGRYVGVAGGRARFAGSLANAVASADLKLARLLDRIDQHVREHVPGLEAGGPVARPTGIALQPPPNEVDLRRFGSVVWATGHRPAYPFLDRQLLDRWGRLRHEGGVLPVPGLYALGLPFMRTRASGLLTGVGADARELAGHLAARIAGVAA